MKYRPEIDGLRALAILPVLLFHAGVPGFSGGYLGVDVFFVVSGYLISKILGRQLDESGGTLSFVDFYERRARRLLPALMMVIATVVPVAWLWMTPKELQALGESVMSVMVGGSNILLWRDTGYFGFSSGLSGSLAGGAPFLRRVQGTLRGAA